MLRAEELCRGGADEGASGCPLVDTVRCVACEHSWQVPDPNAPGPCPSCEQHATVAERCESCPVVEVVHYRRTTSTGQMLDRILEHEFDCKHYRIDAGAVSVDLREGLKILESERLRWEHETRERQQEEWQEKQRIAEMQRKQKGF